MFQNMYIHHGAPDNMIMTTSNMYLFPLLETQFDEYKDLQDEVR